MSGAGNLASGKAIRVAMYFRVSREDQHPENQLLQLREFCERWEGHELVAEYVDRESGRRGRRERRDFDRMFADAAARRFDVLLIWALDRFSREGIRKTLSYLERLDACGVAFKSYTEPFLDTDNELLAHIVLAVTSYYAQLEAVRISEKTKAGLERARAQGKVIGRPDGFERWRPLLVSMREEELSQGEMVRRSGLSVNTVKKYLARLAQERLGGTPDGTPKARPDASFSQGSGTERVPRGAAAGTKGQGIPPWVRPSPGAKPG